MLFMGLTQLLHRLSLVLRDPRSASAGRQEEQELERSHQLKDQGQLLLEPQHDHQ